MNRQLLPELARSPEISREKYFFLQKGRKLTYPKGASYLFTQRPQALISIFRKAASLRPTQPRQPATPQPHRLK